MNGTALMWIKIFLILLFTTYVLSCLSWGSYEYSAITSKTSNSMSTQKRKITHKHRDQDGHNLDIDLSKDFGGWTPSPETQKQWLQWLSDYHNKTMGDKNKTPAEVKKEMAELQEERGNWPYTWQNLGPPQEGVNPPPWSYVPKNTGLPDYCLQWPQPGNCSEQIIRWGFNAYDNQCHQFVYTGCGGNQNNYKEKLRCEQACMIPPVSGCDTDSHIPIDSDY